MRIKIMKIRLFIVYLCLIILSFNCKTETQSTELTAQISGISVPPPPIFEEEMPEDTSYLIGVSRMVDKQATYKYGQKAFLEYVATHLKTPFREKGIEGTVWVSCIVETNGTLSHTRVERGIGGGWNELAVGVLEKTTGNWQCAVDKGKTVRSFMVIPMKCKIE
jgi:hypothetical protein